jgi:soluble lytic murein transglycosylase-like protein
MNRLSAMLVLGTLALAPLAAGAGETFACKDAEGVWILGNVEQDRCAGKVKKIRTPSPTPQVRRAASGEYSMAAVKAIVLSDSAYKEHVRAAAEKYNLPEELLHAVMAVESGFRPTAVSEKGAVGLMQLMPDTAREMHVRNSWSPSENIDGGARYLRTLANRYDGDLVKTLAAYNAGPEAVNRARGVPRIPETQDYVLKVLGIYEKLKSRNAKG